MQHEPYAMRYSTLSIILPMFIAGCSDQPARVANQPAQTTPYVEPVSPEVDPIPPEIENALNAVGDFQSQGLKDAKVTVHRTYDYHGYSWLEPLETAKLIAVDIEFAGYNRGLDLDDVDIIDGESNENFGSDPHIAYLTHDGKLAPDPYDGSWDDDMGSFRVLLIYAMLKECKSIKLSYWNQELTPQPIPLAGIGPTLPKPDK